MAGQTFTTKTVFFCIILISSVIFYLLAIPSSHALFSLSAFLLLLVNLFTVPGLVRSEIIQSGYGKINPFLIRLLLLIYLAGMYNFTTVWLENIQHVLWNLIIDNLTDLLAAAFILLYLFIFVVYYLIYQKSRANK